MHASPPPALAPGQGTRLHVPQMDCAAEESDIRRALEPLAGIRALGFHLGSRTLTVDAPPPVVDAAVQRIRAAGYTATPLAGDAAPATPAGGTLRLAAALALAVVAELLHFLAPDTLAWRVAGMATAAAAIGLAGFGTYVKGLQALRHARLNINALMAVAVTGAFAIGQWPEAAMVMALYALAEAIEARAVDRSRRALQGLLALAPQTARVLQPGGQWADQPAAAVPVGAVVRVRPGERLPLDGTVAEGRSTIDQSPVTGESIPVDKAPGDPVFAGTVNQAGLLDVRVGASFDHSTLARIIQAVEQAQGSRAPTQRFVDRFAAVYTPAVFAVALAVAALGPWLFGWAGLDALYKALVLLVIACPCALVISTPVTVVSGLAAAARRGILIKGGAFLEDARGLKMVALDKTGTVTEGRPALVAWEPMQPSAPREPLGAIAAALAQASDHPVSQAIAAGLPPPSAHVQQATALPGRGVAGRIDGRDFVLASHRTIEERGQCSPALEAALAGHEAAGRSVTLLADDEGVLALFAVADTIKPHAREAIAALHALGIRTVMLSGDNRATAEAIAREAGIAEARANLLPEDKLAAIEGLQREHGATAMAGDGINDAPALARADIGIAMGAAGSDTAAEAADVVVMNDDLRRIAETVRLSRRTHALLWQNISLALGIKAAFLVAALLGSATMWMAVFADMGASLLVVANGLRLLRHR
ncbi:heavy metal translocating P-type ATPase [Aquincola sp. MAHUQ-54]|uniref:P-type Zn(2+) transporter n=1 Tax=Aquincola agrisoli TaxID=3119538 RepID=A0AAW9QN90_9BURK